MTTYAAEADVAEALRRALTATESTYVGTAIAEAQDLIEGYLGRADGSTTAYDVGEVPAAVTRVCARMVARVYQQDDGRAIGTSQVQKTAGPFSSGTSYASGSTTGSPWLAAADRQALKPYRVGGGMRSVSMTTERGYDYDPVDDV